MNKEYFDVLDENGNKTGKIKLRSEVHRDGDWHKAVHIWIINNEGDVLLQRRCPTKDSNPNMLDVSCAGHLSAGDNSLLGAIRELKEELNLDIEQHELQFIKTIKKSSKYTETFINNEFDDLYILRTNKSIDDMKFQKEEISEIFFVSYKKFKDMVNNKQSDLLIHTEEFEILFEIFDKELLEDEEIMFNINHVAISVTDIEKSIEFYKKFGFKESKSWKAEDDSIKINMLKLNNIALEIFCYSEYIKLPETAKTTATDLPILGTKHFALGVESIEKAKEFVIQNGICENVDIKNGRLGKKYFFINDPDGILVEIIEND